MRGSARFRRAVAVSGAAAVGAALLTPALAFAQPTDAPTSEVTIEVIEVDPATIGPSGGGEAVAAPAEPWVEPWMVPVEELRLVLAPLTLSELENRAASWTEQMRARATAVSEALVRANRAATDVARAESLARAATDAEVLRAMTDRASIVLDAIESRGVAAGEDRGYVASVRQLAGVAAPEQPDAADGPADEIERGVRAALASLDLPSLPAEVAEPWTIDPVVIDVALRALSTDELNAWTEAWASLVRQAAVRQVKAEVAAAREGDPAVRDRLAVLSAVASAERYALAERLAVAVGVLEERGLPTTAYAPDLAGLDQPAGDEGPGPASTGGAAEPWTVPVAELRLRLAPLRLAEIEQQLTLWESALVTSAAELSTASLERRRATDETRQAALDGEIARLSDVVDALAVRIGVLIEAIEARGGSAPAIKQYVAAVGQLISRPEPPKPAGEVITPEEQRRREVEARVSAAVTAVTEAPPAYAAQEPWVIPVEALVLELTPLLDEQLVEHADKWLALLQGKVLEQNRFDIAARAATDNDVKTALTQRATKANEQKQALVERFRAVIAAMDARSLDVSKYENYAKNVPGLNLDLSDPTRLFTQVWSWATSPSGGVAFALRLLQVIGVLVGFWIVSRVAGAGVSTAVKRVPKASNLLREFLVGGARRVIMLVGVVIAVGTLGVNINPLIAALGAAGLVVGLALQGTLSNLASGILILIYRPFDVGDVINAGGVVGTVETMNLVSTRVLTFDNQIQYVPNNSIWNGVITNITGLATRRVDLKFGIDYSADMARAQKIIEDVITAHPKVLKDPAPVIRVHELADSSVNFIARPWSKTGDYWDVYWDITRRVKERFDEAGVSIPFPQQDLNFKSPVEVIVRNA